MSGEEQFDAIVIGSGFAGAVTACRLSEAGLNICILERGRRYADVDLPTLPDETFWPRTDGNRDERKLPDFTRAFWQLGQGLWELRDLGDLVVGQAAGFGGGSLIYANVHLRAPKDVFDDWPTEYRNGSLDAYYDLAACMLDVQKAPEGLPKTRGLEAAARGFEEDENPRVFRPYRLEAAARGLEEDENPRVFRPPLAINFGAERKNRFGAQQGSCDMNGACIFGCTKQAKNTLDLNYLRRAEDLGAEVRTLAEVSAISAIKSTGDSPRYEVSYRNHLKRGGNEVVRAKYVFLCAGAVNSTELLLRCRGKHLPIAGTGLGTKFYPNADELAVVFDCKEEQEIDRGPTITTAWLYERDGTWLMVQDGGLPAHLEPMLGLFRSPLWLRRNAFAPRVKDDDASKAKPQQAALPQRVGYAALPVDAITDLLTGLTGSALAGNLPLSHEVARSVFSFAPGGRNLERIPDQIRKWTLCPDQLRDALDQIRRSTLADLALLAEPYVNDFVNTTAERMPDGLIASIREMGISNFDIGGRSEADLRKWAMQAGIQGIWGSQAGLMGAIASVMSPLFAPAPKEIVERLASLIRWAFDYRGGDGHSTVLLAMGRDSKPATLELAPNDIAVGSRIHGAKGAAGTLVHATNGVYVLSNVEGAFTLGEAVFADSRPIGIVEKIDAGLDQPNNSERAAALAPLCVLVIKKEKEREDPRRFRSDSFRDGRWESAVKPCEFTPSLLARLPPAHETPERTTQELLLRDIAQHLGGELRTGPLYPFLGRRITVHAQGGCPMAEDAEDGVTKPTGEVFGCDGLYVMDAAAFPTAVGVNPSATIAAVAEWKIEKFIRARLDKNAAEMWEASWSRAVGEARIWAEHNKDWLDPINNSKRREPSPPPKEKPIGIEFQEIMIGTHRPFDAKSITGPECVIKTDLTASIDDLATFLAVFHADTGRALCVTGSVEIDLDDACGDRSYAVDPDHSRIWLRAAMDDCGHQTRSIVYLLEFTAGSDRYQLDGIKDIRDDARFDVWEDTTTLCFVLRKRSEDEHLRRVKEQDQFKAGEPVPWDDDPCRLGVLRLPASEFLGHQVPTLKATNIDEDPARQVWAVTTFARFFLSNLVDVYVPALEHLADVGKRVLGRGHA